MTNKIITSTVAHHNHHAMLSQHSAQTFTDGMSVTQYHCAPRHCVFRCFIVIQGKVSEPKKDCGRWKTLLHNATRGTMPSSSKLIPTHQHSPSLSTVPSHPLRLPLPTPLSINPDSAPHYSAIVEAAKSELQRGVRAPFSGALPPLLPFSSRRPRRRLFLFCPLSGCERPI